VRPARLENPPDEPCGEGKYDLAMPPRALVVPGHEKRLIPALRKAAQTRDPDEILVRAICAAHQAPGDPEAERLARATADLAATGRASAELFERGVTTPGDLAGMAASRLPGVSAGDARLRGLAMALLERAQRVGVLLRKDDAERKAYRLAFPELKGWIAVSGEDDPPHRPVNVPQTPHPTRYANVPVDGALLRTRYVWAGPDHAPLIVLLHGHSSRIEEYDALVDALLSLRDDAGAPRFAVAVPDLPCCGYTDRFDPEEIEGTGSKWPALDYLERFIEGFVATLCAERERPMELALVAGGSLGGNLTLRLAEARVPWARRFAAWSAASVWTSMEGDLIKGCALRTTRERMLDDEVESSRHDYFQHVFADAICGTGRPQPKMWYRDHWPCAARHTNRAMWDRREIYGPEFRRFHWQVAHEQLVFSHVEVTDGRAPWQRIRGPMFLAAGDQDNYMWTHIHDRTADLGRLLEGAGVEGDCWLFANTGHSIQDERPALLARKLDAFLRRC